MIAKAAESFRADIMKGCHHGSEKVTDAFLETVNPAAFVISSGDEEGFRIESGSDVKKWFAYHYRMNRVPDGDAERTELELVD